MNRTTIAVVILLILAAAGAYFIWQGYDGDTAEVVVTEKYVSTEHDFRFEYPNTYVLEERADGFENTPITVINIIPRDVEVPDFSEGPPGIAVLIIPVASSTDLAEWVRTRSISNFALSLDGTLSSTTLGGEEALGYRFSGLYENDAVAVMRGDKVYLFFGAWLASDDMIRTDFENLLRSVQFIEV